MKKELTEDYVAGFMENVGGFVIKRQRDTAYAFFKAVINDVQVERRRQLERCLDWLDKNKGIVFCKFKINRKTEYRIQEKDNLRRFLKFTNEKCNLKKNSQLRVEKYMKVIDSSKEKEKVDKEKQKKNLRRI